MQAIADVSNEEMACRYIASTYGLKYERLPRTHGGYLIDSAASTFDEIMMCDYTSAAIYLASFLHELGHILMIREKAPFTTKYQNEKSAWLRGFQEMEGHFVITLEMVAFMHKCLSTYVNK